MVYVTKTAEYSIIMWSHGVTGKVHWTTEAKLLLVKLVERNSSFLDANCSRVQARRAFDKIYRSLVDAGMPRMRPDLVKKIWTKLKSISMRKKIEFDRLRNGGKRASLNILHAATIEALEKAEDKFVRSVSI